MHSQGQYKLRASLRVPHVNDLFLVGFLQDSFDNGWLVEMNEIVNGVVVVLSGCLGDAVSTVVTHPDIITLRCEQVGQAVGPEWRKGYFSAARNQVDALSRRPCMITTG